ncbi:MAG TPA: undecaprenyl-diphosphate phosphatase [Bacilli bacterium]
MFDIWVAIIIGIVEGLTEFLPVSSTGHMILVGHLLGFTGPKAETFEIIIQLGAILAVVLLYWRRILRLFGVKAAKGMEDMKSQLNLLHILIAITPAMALAFVFKDFIKILFLPETVVIGLVTGGIFLIVAEKQHPKISAKTIDELTYRQVFYIGMAQILSLWPGFSRSGATIAGGMLAGASRAASADFTFLIAIPVMVAATGYEMLQNYQRFSVEDLGFLAVGFIVSFVVALLAVVTFIKLVQKFKLTYFAYYRFVLAAAVILYMLLVGM